jgi:hypothetical protein
MSFHGLTVCITCVGAGVDSAWKQENPKPEKCSKLPQNPTRQVHPRKIASHHVSRKDTMELCPENALLARF